MTEPSKSEQARIYHQLAREYEHQDNIDATELTAKLIEAGRDEVDCHIAHTLHALLLLYLMDIRNINQLQTMNHEYER